MWRRRAGDYAQTPTGNMFSLPKCDEPVSSWSRKSKEILNIKQVDKVGACITCKSQNIIISRRVLSIVLKHDCIKLYHCVIESKSKYKSILNTKYTLFCYLSQSLGPASLTKKKMASPQSL
jgi:hypothetical protein